jgi:hypothetical protein
MTIKQQDIELEAALLKSLAVKKNFDKFYKVLDNKRLIPVTNVLLKDYAKYYEKYNNDIDWDVFYTDFSQNYHKKDMDENDIAYYRETVFPLIKNSEIKDSLYTSLLEREATVKINEVVDSGFCHKKIEEIVASLKNQLHIHQKCNNDERFKRMTDVDLASLHNENGISWWSPALQAGIGSLAPGQFILVAADSNAGKSACVITQVAHTLKLKTGRPILYFDSEHTDEELRGRILSNLYREKVPEGFEAIAHNQERIYKHFAKEYGTDSIYTYQLRSPNDLKMIESAIEKFNPCLVVIDMIDKMSNSLAVTDLTPLYDHIRSLANTGYPIIGTTQAGNTSYQDKETGQYKHRKKLTDKDTAGSKYGKQGAAYCMLMIGQDDDMPGVRYLTTTKKKRGRAVSLTCRLDEKYSLYEEIL